METAKREAQSLPMSEHKRPRNGVPSVKKITFSRCESTCVSLAKDDEIRKNRSFNTTKSKSSRRSTSRKSFRESDVCAEKRTADIVDDIDHGLSGQNAFCSTPFLSRVHDKDGSSSFCKTFNQRKDSPFRNGFKSLINNSSFYDDDADLAALNLSEIITSSCPASNALGDDNDQTSLKDACDQFYGLPMKVKELLLKFKGIETLYDWQMDCLNLPAVKERKNLIYSLPTSGGKTLVAEILIFKELLLQRKDVLFILPFVSIVQEKVKSLSQFAIELGFLVEEYAASRGKLPPRKRHKKKSVYVATIEKANALVNSLIGEDRLSTLGIAVVDELHMLGEVGRGATLEMCLSKLMFASPLTQIIGMSATLSNIGDLKQFLKADIYSNDFRPVELKEFYKLGCDIYEVPKASDPLDKIYKPVRTVKNKQGQNKELLTQDPDQLLALVLEVVPKHSCLIFCSTKKNCQNLALLLVKFMPSEMMQVKAQERHQLMKALFNEATALCPVLKKTIPFGLAYHHSGLTMDERKLIEDGYSQGVLCLLTCTSTLAAGVNLPAKRVIVRAPYVGSALLSQSQYKQMVGRAGRAGIDTSGESILIVKEAEKPKIGHLFSGPMESCLSRLLVENGKGLCTLVLTLIGLKICKTVEEVKEFMHQSTLLFVQSDYQAMTLDEQVETCLHSLQQLGHVTVSNRSKAEVTRLGQATFKGCVDLESSPVIYQELERAHKSLVLDNELHLLYLVTPMDMRDSIEPEWMSYFKQVISLNDSEQEVARLVGATESILSRRASGLRAKKNDNDSERPLKRFYLTLILHKLMKEHTIWETAALFNVTRGFVQNLLTSTSSFASCMVHFTRELNEFWGLNLLLEAMVKKLSYTASLELIPLMEVPGVKQARARQLFKAGYKSLSSLAWADVNALVSGIEHLSRRQANQIVSAAKMLLQEKADALREEAEEMTCLPQELNRVNSELMSED
ncbi:helicase POLQ-like isoform X1 [Montipora foliosa]|uniref:helicase POLQ-like isoform X1 n=1 Tax=Montipora foliosa TaxID=591990 RepID=UPI0035F1A75B